MSNSTNTSVSHCGADQNKLIQQQMILRYKMCRILFQGRLRVGGVWDDSWQIEFADSLREHSIFHPSNCLFPTKEEALSSAVSKAQQWVDAKDRTRM